MSVNNTMDDRLGASWWDDAGPSGDDRRPDAAPIHGQEECGEIGRLHATADVP